MKKHIICILICFAVLSCSYKADAHREDIVLRESIKINTEGNYNYKFKLNTKGLYGCGLYFHSINDKIFGKGNINTDLIARLSFYSAGKKYKSFLIKNKLDTFLGIGGAESGVIFSSFKTPQDLPLSEDLFCEVEIIKPITKFPIGDGPYYFFIRQLSDW